MDGLRFREALFMFQDVKPRPSQEIAHQLTIETKSERIIELAEELLRALDAEDADRNRAIS